LLLGEDFTNEWNEVAVLVQQAGPVLPSFALEYINDGSSWDRVNLHVVVLLQWTVAVGGTSIVI
jgi:hypothetical protein